jgi:hypothetical protein
MCGQPFSSTAIDVYCPTLPALSTVSILQELAPAVTELANAATASNKVRTKIADPSGRATNDVLLAPAFIYCLQFLPSKKGAFKPNKIVDLVALLNNQYKN